MPTSNTEPKGPFIPDLHHLFGLQGRSVIVTGAGAGIGRGIARYMAAAGARLIIADINQDAARETTNQISDATNGSVEAIPVEVDVADEGSVAELFAAAKRRFDGVDVLVNNAGVTDKCPFTEVTLDQWDRIHSVNLRGVFLCMREAVRHMKERACGGCIVNISSISSLHVGAFGNSPYGASKSGVNNLTRSVALEYAGDGIRVNAVLPGVVKVERNAAMRRSPTMVAGPLTESHRIPLGRMGEPDDIAAAVLFLASPGASYITGQLLTVDGGFLVS